MNRLILVGNGFDLAHGLETGYNHFIDDFWKTQIEEIKLNLMLRKYYINFDNEILNINNSLIMPHENISINEEVKNYITLKHFLENYKTKIEFKNIFFEELSKKYTNRNWVSIEEFYYQILKNIFEGKNQDYAIYELNEDFQEVKKLLEKYLTKVDKSFKSFESINNHIQSIFNLRDIESKYQSEIVKLIIYNTNQNEIEIEKLPDSIKIFIKNLKLQNSIEREKFVREQVDEVIGNDILKLINLYPTQTIILNFNYTKSTKIYSEEFNKINRQYIDYNISEIHIHGELDNKENPIIFGFGDDVDEKYKEFENLNDNRYLENFKSIAYLQTDNYKKLLEFIDSEEYQVFIFGHSCGISDRTMLNTIFEHDNCKSIKPFYHKRDNGTDNYTEIVQNISRNFKDKTKFRDRVVNKTYCEPLT